MKYWASIFWLLLSVSCNQETGDKKQFLPTEPQPVAVQRLNENAAWPEAEPVDILLAGADYFLEDTILAGLLGGEVLNAAISREPLSGLNERLPALLSLQPRLILMEVGAADERAGTAPAVLDEALDALARQLKAQEPMPKVLVLNTAGQLRLERLVEQFARGQGWSVLAPERSSPDQVAAQALRQIREVVD